MALHHAAANGAVSVLKMMMSDSLKVQAPSGLVSLKDARKLNLVTNCRYAHIVCALQDYTLGLTVLFQLHSRFHTSPCITQYARNCHMMPSESLNAAFLTTSIAALFTQSGCVSCCCQSHINTGQAPAVLCCSKYWVVSAHHQEL